MPDGRYHWFGIGEELIHSVGGVSEDNLVVVLRDHILLPGHHSRVVLVVKQLQQVIDGELRKTGMYKHYCQ